MTFFSSASLAEMLALSATAEAAHSALRPRSSARDRAKATVSFFTFSAMVSPPAFSGSVPVGPITGAAAPMLVAGAIAATCEASVTNTPALPALAPGGPTHTRTGTSERRKALTICRVDSSAPPGVSSTTSNAADRRFSASRTHAWR